MGTVERECWFEVARGTAKESVDQREELCISIPDRIWGSPGIVIWSFGGIVF